MPWHNLSSASLPVALEGWRGLVLFVATIIHSAVQRHCLAAHIYFLRHPNRRQRVASDASPRRCIARFAREPTSTTSNTARFGLLWPSCFGALTVNLCADSWPSTACMIENKHAPHFDLVACLSTAAYSRALLQTQIRERRAPGRSSTGGTVCCYCTCAVHTLKMCRDIRSCSPSARPPSSARAAVIRWAHPPCHVEALDPCTPIFWLI